MLTESSIVCCPFPKAPRRTTRHHQDKEENLKASDPKSFQKEHCTFELDSGVLATMTDMNLMKTMLETFAANK
jgi:hypothetical protein